MPDVVEIESEEHFLEFIKAERSVVSFTAPAWCGPCKALEPRYAVAASQTDIPFAKVDVDVLPHLAADYLVMSVPTVIEFKAGDVIGGIAGRTPKAILDELG